MHRLRPLPPTRVAAAIVALLAARPASLAAQAHFTARLGVTWSSTLVEDEIRTDEPITLEAGIAPTLVLGADLPLTPKNRVGLEVALARSDAEVDDAGTTSTLTSLTTATFTVGLDGRIRDPLRWRAAFGAIKYLPGEDVGVFREGGPWRWVAGAGLDWSRPLNDRLSLTAGLRYDYHRFTTDALRDQGFANPEAVHRVAVTVGVGL
ncbi:MAG TPA: hypothetical protein VLA95_01955 [Gemmatimonadales bacterium]|nr:hypothetical protein [Gemmatimonadales bacterium]